MNSSGGVVLPNNGLPEPTPSQPRQSQAYQLGMKFVAGGLSNMAASAVTNPLDIIKVRQQLELQKSTSESFWIIGARMARNEGVKSLMNGLSASMMREAVFSSIRLGSYDFLKQRLYMASRGLVQEDAFSLKLVAATISGALGSAMANPTDLVKIRMQAYYPNGSPYRSARHAFASVYREGGGTVYGGIKSLLRGVTPTTFRGVVVTVSQISTYDQIKQTMKAKGLLKEGIGLHSAASFIAGLICSIASSPVDVIKVRLMNDKNRELRGVLHCTTDILRREGLAGFYKGFTMCWARLGTHTIVTFLVYERLRLIAGIPPM